jgi:hypothetical protein
MRGFVYRSAAILGNYVVGSLMVRRAPGLVGNTESETEWPTARGAQGEVMGRWSEGKDAAEVPSGTATVWMEMRNEAK